MTKLTNVEEDDMKSKEHHKDSETSRSNEKSRIDPVCGMDLSDRQPWTGEFEGKTYYFCSTICKNVFEKEPHRYIDTIKSK